METTVIGSYPVVPSSAAFSKSANEARRGGFFDPFTESMEEAVGDQIRAGIDIVSDGQVRNDMIGMFASRLRGIRKFDGVYTVVGDIGWKGHVTVADQTFLKERFPGLRIKGIVTGPYTMARSVRDEHYGDVGELTMAFARALNNEVRALDSVADVIDVDEPYLSVEYPEFAKEAVRTVFKGAERPTCLHVCGDVSSVFHRLAELSVDILSHEFKANPNLLELVADTDFPQDICLGSVRSDSEEVETVADIEAHLRRAVSVLGEKVVHAAPDCGLKRLPRQAAFSKLARMTEAVRNLHGQD